MASLIIPDPPRRRLRIALCQCNLPVGDLAGNLDRIADLIAEARDGGAQLVVFPELSVTGYPGGSLLLNPALAEAAEAGVRELASTSADTVAVVAPRPRPGSAQRGRRAGGRRRLMASRCSRHTRHGPTSTRVDSPTRMPASLRTVTPRLASCRARLPTWTQLSYRIKNFSAEVDVQVQLESLPAAEVEAALIKSPQGVPIKVWQTTESNKNHRPILGRFIFKSPVKTINHVWFNPKDATALGRIRLRRGNADFKNVYRFTEQGVFRHQREPKDQQETSKQPEKWTDVKDTSMPITWINWVVPTSPNVWC